MSLPLRKHDHCLLREATVALELPSSGSQREKPVITQLEAGEMIEIQGPVPGLAGMIAVRRRGHAYAIFSQDLEDRAFEVTALA